MTVACFVTLTCARAHIRMQVNLLQRYGPAQQGITYLNMMVNNVASSCADMAAFWKAPGLHFLPQANKVLGVWGENLPAWILKNPGCTDGSDALFPWIKDNGVGIGIWQARHTAQRGDMLIGYRGRCETPLHPCWYRLWVCKGVTWCEDLNPTR